MRTIKTFCCALQNIRATWFTKKFPLEWLSKQPIFVWLKFIQIKKYASYILKSVLFEFHLEKPSHQWPFFDAFCL